MPELSRRRLLAGAMAAGAGAVLGGCEALRVPGGGTAPGDAGAPGALDAATASPRRAAPGAPQTRAPTSPPIQDGSWPDAGRQPGLPTPRRLVRGDPPPQFVVVSWDGAGESVRLPLLSHFRGVAKELKASMTLFLSGIYLVPKDRRTIYRPPGRAAGSSAIPFLGAESVRATIDGIGKAWLEGHEVATHFNGHFCGPGGVRTWTPDQWKDEIAQAVSFVSSWRTTTGFTDLEPFPFDYRRELVGGRAPCLEGSTSLRGAAEELGWRYDSSSTGTQVWPRKVGRLWALDLPSIPFSGRSGAVISMDYNMMYSQSRSPNGDASKRAQWQQEAAAGWLAGFRRAYDGNRAPYFIGNHFEDWNGGIYMTAVEQVMRTMATYPDTRFVSFRQLCDVLDAQDPAVLARLRSLPVGTAPKGGWRTFLPA